MKSNLKMIYNKMDIVDLVNKPEFLFAPNPIFQVNKFITKRNKLLNANLINNLQDLKIERTSTYKNSYDYNTNTLFCNERKADVFGLLHVASNDRDKKYTGIISEDNVGYGINNGLTEVFTYNINGKKISYKLEAIISRALATIDAETLYHSYFTNNACELLNLNDNIKELMQCIDVYHDNNFQLIPLYQKYFCIKLNKFKSYNQLQVIEELNNKIIQLEEQNYEYIYKAFNLLIVIINNSKLSEHMKQMLFMKLTEELNSLFANEQYSYLQELTSEFENNIYVKRKTKWKK